MNGASQKSILIVLGVVACAGVGGSAWSKESAVQIIGFCSLICVSLLSLLGQLAQAQRQDEKQDAAAKKVDAVAAKAEEVKVALVASDANSDAKLEGIKKTGEAVHTLVNSNMGTQLKLNAVVTRRLSDLTKDAADLAAAALADKMLAEHLDKQAVVDARDARDAKKPSGGLTAVAAAEATVAVAKDAVKVVKEQMGE